MPRPHRIQFAGALYHLITRGVEKRDIFLSEKDFNLFLKLLEIYCARFKVLVLSYCLMNNHIHLLAKTLKPNLALFMKHLLEDYAMYFNKEYDRVGHLYQDRYKSLIVDSRNYLLELSRYIHLNPCRSHIVDLPEVYKWSSMKYFMSNKEKSFLKKGIILSRFKSKSDYYNFVLNGTGKDFSSIETPTNRVIIGSDSFVNFVRKKVDKGVNLNFKKRANQFSVSRINSLVEDNDIKIYLLNKYSDLNQSEIGKLFGLSRSRVSQLAKKVQLKAFTDKKLYLKIQSIENLFTH